MIHTYERACDTPMTCKNTEKLEFASDLYVCMSVCPHGLIYK